jgi:hypothetical protein
LQNLPQELSETWLVIVATMSPSILILILLAHM